MSHEHADFERPDVKGRMFFRVILGLFLFVGAAVAILSPIYTNARIPLSGATPQPFPSPRLETHSGQALGPLRAAQDQRMDSYGWVDRKSGIVRIPVARAMAILATRGNDGYAPLHTNVRLESGDGGKP